jgi:hypothetical protein
MSFKVQADIQLMMFPNFVTAKAFGRDIKLDVGEISDSEAAALWDHWKPFWQSHVAERRKRLPEGKRGES